VLFRSGEFQSRHSDLNIVCIVKRAAAADLEALHGVTEWWIRQGHPAPLVFTYEELQRSADVFSIELFDMKNRHRMLYGEDFFARLEVPLHLHRLQVERELRTDWLRLRQAILAAPQTKKFTWKSCSRRYPPFALFFGTRLRRSDSRCLRQSGKPWTRWRR
jgi:hypothetical protein